MSVYNVGLGLIATSAAALINQRPLYGICAIKTQYFDHNVHCIHLRGSSPDGQEGEVNAYIGDGMWLYLRDRGGNYGDPIGPFNMETGYNLNNAGRMNQWSWLMFGVLSLSSRFIQLEGSSRYSDTSRTFSSATFMDQLQVGWAAPQGMKFAHVYLYSQEPNFAGIRAGTVDPTTQPGLIEGWTLRNDFTSVKNLLSLGTMTGNTPTFDPNDHPGFVGGGGGGENPAPAGGTIMSGGFGW